MAITTGHVRCSFDVLGGDLVAKGIQQSLFIGHSVSPSYVNMATIHCRAKFSP